MAATTTRRVRAGRYGRPRGAEVCVVIPVFNYDRYLEPCLRSALGQDGVDLTVLVLDDASSDNSLAVARRIADEDARVHVISHMDNKGHIPTVNEGMALANSEYVVKLDADDMLTDGSLRRSVALLQAFPSVGFVYGVPSIIIGDGAPSPPRSYVRVRRSWTIWDGRQWLRQRFRHGTNCILQPEAAIRLSALRSAGPYRAELPHTSDLEMWMRIAARYDVGRINGAYQGCYREHSASMSRTVHGGLLTDITERVRAFDSVLSDCAAFLPDRTIMTDEVHHALAREALLRALSLCGRGAAGEESVADYTALARRLCSDSEALPEWRTVMRLAGARRTSETSPELLVREAIRVFRHRVQWWRWRWSGV